MLPRLSDQGKYAKAHKAHLSLHVIQGTQRVPDASAGVELLHSTSAVSDSQPLLFRKGDVYTLVGTVMCKCASSDVSPATLSVTWQRSRWVSAHFTCECSRKASLKICA